VFINMGSKILTGSLISKLLKRPLVQDSILSNLPRSTATSQFRWTRSISARATEYLQLQDPDLTESQRTVREAISKVCSKFDDAYWANAEKEHRFPTEFHQAIAKDGWLGICMPAEYGGSDLGIAEAAIMVQTIAESGAAYAGASAVHMNIFGLEPVRKFGTDAQKRRMLVPLIAGKDRACFGVTEPNTGLDTLKLQSRAIKDPSGKNYLLSGQKIWISTAQVAEKILILTRTTPLEEVTKPSQGLSLFYTDLDRDQVQVTEIPKMGRAAVDSNSLFFDGWKVPAEDLIGEENNGFKMIMHGMNAERILIAAEAIGIGFAALRRAALYAGERKVFGRPIGQNQGIQHPLADSWMELEAARLMIYQAARLYDSGYEAGEYANACKYLAAEAAYKACERAVLAHGGMGYAKEYHVERYFREVMIPRIAPVSREMIKNYIGQRVLGLPKSY
jgi:alkylation response protein AidB-like acyl-CoA dehydrogenase